MMQLMKRIWADARRGENIDLYVTVVVAIGLVILNLVGLAPTTWLGPLTLAVLGLLAIAVLGNRYRVEKVLESVIHTPEEPFQERFPDTIESDLAQAKEVWLIGVSLSRTVKSYYSVLERKLTNGDTIRVLLVHPDGSGSEMAQMREYRQVKLEHRRSEIRSVLEDLCALKSIAPDKLEVRAIDYPLGFGGFAINPETATGVLYLEHYPFKTPGGSLPKFVLSAHDGRWYEFFKTEMQLLWESGRPWNCSQGYGD